MFTVHKSNKNIQNSSELAVVKKKRDKTTQKPQIKTNSHVYLLLALLVCVYIPTQLRQNY